MADLISFFLDIYLDIKYWIKYKKQRKFEKENNLPKSIVWYPYIKQFAILFSVLFAVYFLVVIFILKDNNQKKTTKRMTEISKLLASEKKQFGKFPSELKDIIRNNPLRSNITIDSWKAAFVYIPSKGGQNYQLISLGGDGILSTKDDIVYSSK
ncbi:hypothetical protein [Polaribacter sp. L3A8]|uniref:hypothetical protein n=1 Tax=Polaribacter sp. L3A8 TaxID=2686361 RepID=UPI00131C2D34|nr:hypothetical protein [Polaribacter sp. L3A8]